MESALHQSLWDAVNADRPITPEAAVSLLNSGPGDLPEVLHAASTVRTRHFGNRVKLCSIVNAKCGACSEDCTFCAQSAHYKGPAREGYPLLGSDRITDCRRRAGERPVKLFGVVTSGEALGRKDLERLIDMIRNADDDGPSWCASLGCLDTEDLVRLREAGLKRYHHNLETARSFFPKICTTHSYDRRVETVRNAKKAGLRVCSGGIFGLGESREQRVELAVTLAEEGVDSIPINFLVAIDGTPLENMPPLPAHEILLTAAMFRLTNPRSEVRMAAGRQHLGTLQPLIFFAGCTGMMVGELLTIKGEDVERDLEMLRQLGLEPELD